MQLRTSTCECWVLDFVVRSQEEMTAAQINFGPSCPRREKPNIVPSHSVCRQLFGPVNHEQMREDLLREKRKLTEENTARWNFDFENGIPLVGKYVWERIRPNLTKEMPISSCDDRVSETAKREHSCRFSLPSAETTTTSTTSSGLTNHTISDDTESEPLQNDKCDPDKPPKHLKKRKTSKKITGEWSLCFCFRALTFVTLSQSICDLRRTPRFALSLTCMLQLRDWSCFNRAEHLLGISYGLISWVHFPRKLMWDLSLWARLWEKNTRNSVTIRHYYNGILQNSACDDWNIAMQLYL